VQGQVNIGQQQAFAATEGEISEGNHEPAIVTPKPLPGLADAVSQSMA
jgi:hypothetical protein